MGDEEDQAMRMFFAAFAATLMSMASAQAAPERWQPVSHTASAITGSVSFAPDRITFQNGTSLALAQAGTVPVTDVNGRRISATLFRVTAPDDPVLQNGNRLCGGRTPMPVTYIAVWRHAPFGGDVDPRDLAVFTGTTPPATADRSCATYSYEAASGAATPAASGSARLECPASVDGHRILNWGLYDGARPLPQKLAGDGTANVVWSIAPDPARRGVRLVCGYRDTRVVRAIPVPPAARRCLNREESHVFECN